jgi:outer membrane murein-binding lipoprotein Lpp
MKPDLKMLLPTAASAALLLLSGCGGSASVDTVSTTIPTSSIAKAEFLQRANAICRRGASRLLEEVTDYQTKHIDELSVKLIPATMRVVIRPELEDEIEQIQALGAPRGGARAIERFFSTLLDELNEIIGEEATTFSQAEGMLIPAGKIARGYGLDQCRYALVEAS